MSKAEFQEICSMIGRMSSSKIVEHLNLNGITYRSCSVRDRRLFKAGYRMLKCQNYEISATMVSKMKLLTALKNILNNKVKPDEVYIPKMETVMINELIEDIEVKSSQEHIAVFQHYNEKKILSFDEVEIVPNHRKINHINEMKKISQGKLNKTQKRILNRLKEEEKPKLDFLCENNYFPELKELLSDQDEFKKCMTMISSFDFFPEEMILNVFPWAKKELSSKWEMFYNSFERNDSWRDLKEHLNNPKTFDDLLVEKGVTKEVKYDEAILAEPDMIEKTKMVETIEYTPIYFDRYKSVKWEVKTPSSTNHRGIKPSEKVLQNLAEEIYKISDLPGFSILKTHWNGIYKNNKELEKKIEMIKQKINLKYRSKIKKLRKNKLNVEKEIKIKKQNKNIIKEERELIRSLCLENKKFLDEIGKKDKEEIIKNIKSDVISISKRMEHVGDIVLFNRMKKPSGNMPAFAFKRYQAILRSFQLNQNLYESLDYHFKQFKQFKKQCHNRRSSLNEFDY
jgi:hypothetical protein